GLPRGNLTPRPVVGPRGFGGSGVPTRSHLRLRVPRRSRTAADGRRPGDAGGVPGDRDWVVVSATPRARAPRHRGRRGAAEAGRRRTRRSVRAHQPAAGDPLGSYEGT